MADIQFSTVDEYIALFPPEVQERLSALRRTIREAAPDAQEKIAYQMPAYALHGALVYFAAFTKHIGFYPGASGVEAFTPQLSTYHTSKGTVQFPFDQPLPLDLVREIVQYRAAENLRKAAEKKKK